MRSLAKIAILALVLCLGHSIVFNAAAFAQVISPAATDESENSSNLAAEIISAAEQQGVRVIVIDGTAQSESAPSHALRMTQGRGISLMLVQSTVLEFRETLKAKLGEIPDAIRITRTELEKNSPTGNLDIYFRVLYWTILLLALGAFVEREIYIKRIVQRWLEPDLKANPKGYLEKLPLLIKRALLKAVGVFISMFVAFFTGSLVFSGTPPESIQFSIATLYIGYAACRLLNIVWRLLLAPYLDQYRIPHFSNTGARKLYRWLWAITSIIILAIMFSTWVGELGGNSDIHAAMVSVFGGIVALANILLVIANRNSLSQAILDGKAITEAGAFPRFLSKVWLAVAIGYFIFAWLQMTYYAVLAKPLATPLIAGAYGILISVLCVYALINYFIERVFQREKRYVMLTPEPADDADPATEVTAIPATDDSQIIEEPAVAGHSLSTYQDLARRVAGILAMLTGAFALTKIWNIDSTAMFSSTIQRSTDAIAILFIGYIVYHAVRIWIDNKIQEEGGDTALAPGDEGGATGASRLATLLPLFRNFMLGVIFLSVIFSAMLEMGINVSPLFASAGVVGLAIGFGAQTLVRDIFSGAFYLFDDAFRRGEYVNIGSVKGTVEKISVRSFQLRHHLGPLHTIPFGEIQSLTNYSRDWVVMKLKLRLTYDTDPERVRKLVKKLGQSLLNDPQIGHTFMQPLKSQGVIEMQDSAMIVRVKFMSKPGDQWVIRKRAYQEIRDLFQREGIKFANKEVTVRLAGDTPHNLSEKQATTLAAAALDDEGDGFPQGPDDDR